MIGILFKLMGFLADHKALIIFTTSPTGLGHIRVMDALKDGLPTDTKSVEIGIENISAAKIHSLGSRVPFFTKVTEFYQTNPIAETIFTKFYINYLKKGKKEVLTKFSELSDKFPNQKSWVVVSTHYALAYPITFSRNVIEKKFGVKLTICVVMTDDSPQKIWAIPDTDLIFCPSEATKNIIGKFLKNQTLPKLSVVSFPVSPKLTRKLDKFEIQKIEDQMDPEKQKSLHIEIPISGAAVQLDFFQKLIKSLSQDKFEFTVVGQKTIYSQTFFDEIRKFPKVQISIGSDTRQTVDLYESLFYQASKPAVEITKPSEQVFKAILKPTELGGVVLLLTPPIGRQEKDNLQFLVRHDLLPNNELQKDLEDHLLISENLPAEDQAQWLYRASHWRAIRLPFEPKKAATFIKNLKSSGILLSMLSYVPEGRPELTSNGVSQIWEEIDKYLSAAGS
ncbi:hypothetical protein A3A50_04195 [Candidatus Woesebacteria bacterium RIFCSPLOWO2_01_FULL_38_20]|nr:MAG: hypothetical protein A3A50_04195 [Candidatus Woesebacteria bacterium RIFCSPLOWO2_01_FULL_38_20]